MGGGGLVYGRHLLQVVIFIAPVNYTVDNKYGVWLLQKYGKGKSMGQLCPSGHKVYCLPGRSYKELYHLYVPLGSYLKVQNSSKQNRIAYKARIYCTIFLIKACLHTQS